MTQAVFGLLGVVVGALVTGGVTLWTEQHKARREANAAALLLWDDLGGPETIIEHAIATGSWGDSPADSMPVDLWKELRPVVARVKFPPWYPTTGAYDWLAQLSRRAKEREIRQNTPVPEADDPFLGYLDLGLSQIAIARDALAAYGKQATYKSEAVKEYQRKINAYAAAMTRQPDD